MLRYLVHDGDMFGIVSTGTSSISEQLTYDRQVLEAAVSRITGSGMRPDAILRTATSGQGHPELRFRAHVAFKTAYELMRNLESLRNRRKAVIYISSGYDFNPFATSRMKYQAEMLGIGADEMDTNPFLRPEQQGQQFAEADLWRELGELTRAANRANATFYTIDPRGLMTAQQDLGNEQVDTAEWLNHIRQTQDSLRILAEETGGIAVVNQNGFDAALKRIDAETSDYYVLGYYSSNPRSAQTDPPPRGEGLAGWRGGMVPHVVLVAVAGARSVVSGRADLFLEAPADLPRTRGSPRTLGVEAGSSSDTATPSAATTRAP